MNFRFEPQQLVASQIAKIFLKIWVTLGRSKSDLLRIAYKNKDFGH